MCESTLKHETYLFGRYERIKWILLDEKKKEKSDLRTQCTSCSNRNFMFVRYEHVHAF
ncbi:hypothetical protein DAI22_12g140150 [Oryza sativa Japonica Group]|nr:hypothetical protein DAI22_12g140150 [Oryza sativa Japonica Group]